MPKVSKPSKVSSASASSSKTHKHRDVLKSLLTLSKDMHMLSSSLPVSETASKLKEMASEANGKLVCLRRKLHLDTIDAQIKLDLLTRALKEELVDRDANAARVADRHRVLDERGNTKATLHSRSRDAASQIAASIATLCPWQLPFASDTIAAIAAEQDGSRQSQQPQQ